MKNAWIYNLIFFYHEYTQKSLRVKRHKFYTHKRPFMQMPINQLSAQAVLILHLAQFSMYCSSHLEN